MPSVTTRVDAAIVVLTWHSSGICREKDDCDAHSAKQRTQILALEEKASSVEKQLVQRTNHAEVQFCSILCSP